MIDMAPTTSSVMTNSVVIHFRPSDPPAVSYKVQYRTHTTNYQDGPKIAHSDNFPEYSIKLDNLIANTEYEIRVVPLYGPQEIEGLASPSVFVTTSQQSKYIFLPLCQLIDLGNKEPKECSVLDRSKHSFIENCPIKNYYQVL